MPSGSRSSSSARRRALLGRRGLVKRIHVNRQALLRGEDAVTVQTSAGPVPARRAVIRCECGRMVGVLDQDAKPLSCGARLYVETFDEVEVD